MKLEEFLPEAPLLMGTMEDLNAKLGMNSEMFMNKAAGDTGESPSFGIDYIVNTYIKNQIAFRKQLIQDLQTIAFQVEEIRGPFHTLPGKFSVEGLHSSLWGKNLMTGNWTG